MLNQIKSKVLDVKSAIALFATSIQLKGVSCSSLLEAKHDTAWTQIGEWYGSIFWPVWGVAWILFVWGPAKFKEVVKSMLILMPIVYFIMQNKEVIAATGKTIANWFIGN